MAFVLDASVAVGWVIATQATEYSRRVRRLAKSEPYHAPALWRLEVSNAVRSLLRRRRMSGEAARTAIAILDRMAPVTHSIEADAVELFDLAVRFDLSVYDAVYLWLALSLRLPLACSDGPLCLALRPAGVKRV